ncbi:MAG: hypothetical protein NTW11_00190 [Candidatus Staskawiczbacteria bacterium]|nr:hypothetical protein [Candidatus Staskawiczbacteria bacterium]
MDKTKKIIILTGLILVSAVLILPQHAFAGGVTASCSVSQSPVQVGQSVTFTATAGGGAETYTYSWASACIGNTQSCTVTFDTPGIRSATVSVVSGTSSASASCSVTVVAAPIICSTNSQCGTDANIGLPFCQSGNVYQNRKAYTCNNPGTITSYCSDSTASQLQTTCTGNQICTAGACVNQTIICGSNTQCGTSGLIGSPYCLGNNVYQNYKTYTCNNAATFNSYCSDSTASQLQTTCTGAQVCTAGACTNQTINCSTNSQCGTSGVVGSPYCQGGNVYNNYKTFTCNNAGTVTSYCSDSTAGQLQTTCTANQICSIGAYL